MASSGNFCTLNPLDNANTAGYGNCTFDNGNLEGTGASTGNFGLASTIATGNTGKYYAEFYLVATNGSAYVGYYSVLQTPTMLTGTNKWVPNSSQTWSPSNLASYFQDGTLYKDGSTTSSWGASFTTGDIIQIAIDADNDAVYYGKNNTWQNSGDPTSGSSKTGAARTSIPKNVLPAVGHANGGSSTATWHANFGQDSTFGGTISAGGNADANGFGDFKYAPPSGYVALSTANLPISDDIDPAQTDDDFPQKQFNTVLYTGNATNGHAITGLGFQPDMVWIMRRSGGTSFGNGIIDSSRGATKGLYPDRTDAENDFTNDFQSFDSDGFTLKSGSSMNINNSGSPFVAWCWKANGGTTASNSDGATTTTVQANTKAGFSIVECPQYTSNSTFGHGLNSAPEFMIVKLLGASQWAVYHTGLTSAGYYLRLNTSDAQATGTFFNSTAPTDDVFSLGASFGGSGASIAYCWHSVEGYSKFGKFEGNSNTDGPFVYTGFRPRLVFCKAIDASENWQVRDTARSTFNANSQVRIYWNSSNPETSASTASPIDFLSNGFKVRGSNSEINTNTIIFGAWGDVPFKYNNTF